MNDVSVCDQPYSRAKSLKTNCARKRVTIEDAVPVNVSSFIRTGISGQSSRYRIQIVLILWEREVGAVRKEGFRRR